MTASVEIQVLQDGEDKRYRFHPFSRHIFSSSTWQGTRDDLFWLWQWIRPYKNDLNRIGLAFFAALLFSLLLPRIIGRFVDSLQQGLSHTTFWLLGVYFLSWLMKLGADLGYKYLIAKFGLTITEQMRRDLFLSLHQREMRFFDQNSSGKILSRTVSDVTNTSQFFSVNLFTVIADICTIVGSLFMMTFIHPLISLAMLFIVLPLGLTILNVTYGQMIWTKMLRAILSRLSSHTAETMTNIGVFHTSTFAPKWLRRHSQLQYAYQLVTTKAIMVWGLFSSSHVALTGCGYGIVISLGVWLFQSGSLTLGDLISLLGFVYLIFGPLMEISDKLNHIFTALASTKRLRETGATSYHLPTPLSHHRDIPAKVHITFQDLCFAYEGQNSLFEDFQLHIKAGEKIALIGRTGSGKTSLTQLLTGLYRPQSGKILLNQTELHTIPHSERPYWIGHISQDMFWFTETLRENLRLYHTEITDHVLKEKCEQLGLSRLLAKFENGLDTVIQPTSLNLSQGEKQLLLLVRVLLFNPPLLILDEATSYLDPESEAEWMRVVQNLFKDRTVLMIAHRQETYALADRLIELHEGKIIHDDIRSRG